MVEGEKKNFVMSAMVPDDPSADYKSKVGIIEDHAYAVLKAIELRTGEKLMQFRNPWGKVCGRYPCTATHTLRTPRCSQHRVVCVACPRGRRSGRVRGLTPRRCGHQN